MYKVDIAIAVLYNVLRHDSSTLRMRGSGPEIFAMKNLFCTVPNFVSDNIFYNLF